MTEAELVGPTSRFYVSQRLRLHYVDWGNADRPTLVLVHGGRDHARSWDDVARVLRRDHHVVAPDLRGHGDSAWAIGGMYALVDYVLDLAQLLDALGPEPVILVGHSLGGAVVLQYTGLFPERVRKAVAIEGLGPSPALVEKIQATPAAERMTTWIEAMRRFAARHPRRYPSLADAVARMREENPFLSERQARHLTEHGVTRNEDGTFSWKFDNYVRSGSPYGFNARDAYGIWGRIRCPVLLVRGTESWASDPVADGRIAHVPNARLVNVDGAAHWVHHDRLEAFLDALAGFLAEPAG
ncbi:MAG TPA: alpha/beta hydrolase [Myxococcota bacterium]|nr:alpha/beta hydrolase [Myxococcota bacterium]